MTVNHSVRLANDQARQPAALVRALTPCKPISEDKLQALLLNPTFWPKGIAAVALAGVIRPARSL